MAKGMATEEAKQLMGAISESLAIATFSLDGEILSANQRFLEIMGYELGDVVGKHHRIFVDPGYAQSEEYQEFWKSLASGKSTTAEFKRFGKGGREIWLQGTYMLATDSSGQPVKIVKVASDVTASKLIATYNAGMIAGIERAMAVIEFQKDGTIISANQNFLNLTGYSLSEITGQHHSLFVGREYAHSEEYAEHWRRLGAGESMEGRYKRFSKTGEEIWLQATYAPILSPDGEVVKIVKFAYDITTAVHQADELEQALEASHKAKELEIELAKANEAERARKEMDLAIQELSTPVTPIWDQILLLPLVGILDSTRAASIMTKSLEMISQTRARIFVLDISGVATVDTAVANQLIKITKATQLMGCEAIISGLSPAIARTIVELGVNVGEIRTTATLRDAFETALASLGTRIGQSRQEEKGTALSVR
ncbi:PAS domain S-box protein [Vulcanococcus limneticus]|uniref:PAS domain S-box protein n=1 Tax=Vulcanococcus limneticus TaxID=2170428 RepID=UPI00398C099A